MITSLVSAYRASTEALASQSPSPTLKGPFPPEDVQLYGYVSRIKLCHLAKLFIGGPSVVSVTCKLAMGASMGKNASFLEALPSTPSPLHVVMLGLDSAGKTTALYRLKFDQYMNTVPTIGFNCEKIRASSGKAKGITFLVWDVGGQEKLRPLWKSYTRCTDGIVFVLDSVDLERMEEAKMELLRTAKAPENSSVPILVLANKQDLPGARDPKDIEKYLGLHELGPQHLYHVQPACAIIGEGLDEGLEALYEMIMKKRKMSKQGRRKTR